jgi:guanine deaminase
MPAGCAIRGSFFDFVDDPWKHPGHEDRAARFGGDGLLVVRDGIIEDFGHFADISRRHAGLQVV